MVQALAHSEQYRTDFESFESLLASDEPQWLHNLRHKAFQSFLQSGFPTARRGNEVWKYTDVSVIANTQFGYCFDVPTNVSASLVQSLALDPHWHLIVFVDGQFIPSLSRLDKLPSGIQVCNLSEADSHLTSAYLGQTIPMDTDGFSALSTAFIHDGAFVHLDRGQSLEHPIQILFLTTDKNLAQIAYPRTLIVGEPQSEATIVECYQGPEDQRYFSNAATEIFIGDGAILNRYKLVLEGNASYHVATTSVRQERESTLNAASIDIGGLLVRDNLNVFLKENAASCNLDGLYLSRGNQHIDNHTFIHHVKPNTISRQLYKGVVTDESTAVFSGQVLVDQGAQQSNARQVNKNLVLSPRAQVDTKPHLEIFADDVKCSHGATAGKLDENSLFFLQARGLAREDARGLLTYGFASEIVRNIQLKPLRELADKLLLRHIPVLSAEAHQ